MYGHLLELRAGAGPGAGDDHGLAHSDVAELADVAMLGDEPGTARDFRGDADEARLPLAGQHVDGSGAGGTTPNPSIWLAKIALRRPLVDA
jgi:hypothetical protein